MIANNLALIKKQMELACEKSQRNVADVQLLAVSKKQPTELIRAAKACGQFLFGENYVQELLTKKAELKNENIHWHFIGSLQRKKVKQIVGEVDLIHSVDRLELAQEIDKQAALKNLRQPVLLQVNIGDEDSKSGVSKQNFRILVEQMLRLKNLKIDGVMSLPPLSENEIEIRDGFATTRRLFEELRSMVPEVKTLSMGTTHDFALAIEEGSTMIRVGTAIFGERPTA